MKKTILTFCILISIVSIPSTINAQHSAARQWKEVLLEAIRNDYARPTIHARNLFHTSVAMYDAWAAYDNIAQTYLLGKTVGGYTCPFNGVSTPNNIKEAQKEAISYAAYRLLNHRFIGSPGEQGSMFRFDSLMISLGYDTSFTSTDNYNNSPAALGNYIAQSIIAFGFQDGSNEQGSYANLYYMPVNPPLIPIIPGDTSLVDPNRWQPLTLDVFIDQAGNIIGNTTPDFLSPEWGEVIPFSLNQNELTKFNRDNYDYWVYHDPGVPPLLDTSAVGGISDEYIWNFSLVSIWSSQLTPSDNVVWDISPASIGNIKSFPETIYGYHNFYKEFLGGDISEGHTINPYTGQPYTPQLVPRGDYTRVLAEFWADGPASETPPGHWFTILNYVNDHTLFEKRFNGAGPILDELEWDVKAYFIMGGAVHDAAIASWGIKGWYDYIRPISAIRCMAGFGQSSESNSPNYHPAGIKLIPGYIELVKAGDVLEGLQGANINKIKLYTWKGPAYINNPDTDTAGVGWILADNWWPYQRPTFITPPFAGYISGHSTYSRAAAEVMTLLTGDEYFPGGMGEFLAPKNKFLVFEEGPSVDVVLQWATYRDASDQCSLSRIWGGIHPPADDIPGRIIGKVIGVEAFQLAEQYFNGSVTSVEDKNETNVTAKAVVYPNPVRSGNQLNIKINVPAQSVDIKIYNILGQLVFSKKLEGSFHNLQTVSFNIRNISTGIYFLTLNSQVIKSTHKLLIIK